MTKANDPRTYRELAHKFYVAALSGDEGSRKFNREQGDAWVAYAHRLQERNTYLASLHTTRDFFNGAFRRLP